MVIVAKQICPCIHPQKLSKSKNNFQSLAFPSLIARLKLLVDGWYSAAPRRTTEFCAFA